MTSGRLWHSLLLTTPGVLAGLLGCGTEAKVNDDMATQAALVHRVPYDTADAPSLGTAPERVVVIDTRPTDAASAIGIFRAASTKTTTTAFQPGATLFILSLGPELDSPDQVSVRSLARAGTRFDLRIDYTSARRQGSPIRRNVPWRPLVEIPLSAELSAGHYRINATWRGVESVANDKPLNAAPLVESFNFDVQ